MPMSNFHAVLSPRPLQALRLTGADHPISLGRRTCFGLVCCLLGAADAVALSIAGVVTTERGAAIGGAAIEGATVQVLPQGVDGTSDAPAASATTDERGRFAIADMLAGTYRVAVEADGCAPHDLPSLAVGEDGAALLRVALAPAVFIQGVVVNAKDEVVADAVVATERPGGRMLAKRVRASCIQDEALDFHFNGRSRLYGTVTRQGDPAHATVRVQSLAADARRCGFGAATSTAATPRDCGPIFDASATTSPSGQYAIRGLRDGSYLLEVVGAGHRREVRVASDTRVDVRLRDHERQVDFAGVVTAADTRQPLAGVYVSLRDSTDGTSGRFKATARRTDSRGAFSMRVTPGTYRVFAHKTGFAAVLAPSDPRNADHRHRHCAASRRRRSRSRDRRANRPTAAVCGLGRRRTRRAAAVDQRRYGHPVAGTGRPGPAVSTPQLRASESAPLGWQCAACADDQPFVCAAQRSVNGERPPAAR